MMIDAATEARRRRNWQFVCNSSAFSGFETHAEMQAIVAVSYTHLTLPTTPYV